MREEEHFVNNAVYETNNNDSLKPLHFVEPVVLKFGLRSLHPYDGDMHVLSRAANDKVQVTESTFPAPL